jgi:HemK-like putative methylase
MSRDEEWLLSEKYHGERTEDFFRDCERISVGEPLAYVIGHVPFLNTTIFLDSRPLIPRTETEFWVEGILNVILHGRPSQKVADEKPHTLRILDLCAGSGCIGVAALKTLPESHVDFAEVDVNHHSTILKNIEINDIDISRTRIYGGNLFENVSGPYDFILANPPYIDKALNRTDTSVTLYEPHGALFATDGGFSLIEDIIRAAPEYLTPSGTLLLEHEPEHSAKIAMIAPLFFQSSTTHADQYGIARYTLLSRGADKSVAP